MKTIEKEPDLSYCINPRCEERRNSSHLKQCSSCGTPLLIQNRYRLIEPIQLNDEKYTEIFKIEDLQDNQVIKVMKVLRNPRLKDLFDREAQVLQQLRHPGIPKVELDGCFTLVLDSEKEIDFLFKKELYCVVMEYIQGQDLEQWLGENRLVSQDLALQWLKQLVSILDYVHEHNFFHRDIKPSNIMLRPDGQLCLIDFGSARQISNTYMAKIGGRRRGLTEIVSSGFTAPEQLNGKAVPQSDFYALGRSFVYLLTGKHPVDLPQDQKTGELAWRGLVPNLSSWLVDLINDLMAYFPGHRPLNTEEILYRLQNTSVKQNKRNRFLMYGLIIINVVIYMILIYTFQVWLTFRQKNMELEHQLQQKKMEFQRRLNND
jgi:serine/threonine protein kinase